MKKILIVGALSQEINVVKQEIKNLDLINVKTSFLTTGMGNYNMILNLTRFLENHSFDMLINIGVCGYRDIYKDFFQVGRIKNIANNKELIIPKIIDFGDLESIATSEKVVYDKGEIGEENFVDMESYGFEIVCDSFKIPRVIIKVPVDKIGEETKNFDFKKAENNLKNKIDYKDLLEKLISYIENHFEVGKGKYNFHHSEIEKYNNYFSFTFSENEIFKRLYFRYLALVNKDFDTYFEENKDINKKDFIKNLENFLEDYLVN